MNQTSGQQNTGVNSTFSSTQTNPHTNPFTADLKGEFTSNFGTNTNAVSQIFKDGAFVNNNRARYIAIGAVAFVALIAMFFLFRAGEEDPFYSMEDDPLTAAMSDVPLAEPATNATTLDQGAVEAVETVEQGVTEDLYADQFAEPEPATMMGGGAITLISPASGQSWNYDETMGAAPFEWQGGGGYLVFSRSSSMYPEVMRIAVSGNSYNFNNPYPGTWYWRVENADGASEVRSFHVTEPVRRNVIVQLPNNGGTLAGNGGVVEWTGDTQVAFYRVEFATGGFSNPQYRFATSGNKVQIEGMSPGQYQMRVGAFSEVAGRWEYTQPMMVTVQ